LLLVAPVGWAFGSVWSRGRDLPSPFMAAAGQMLCGGAMIVATGLLRGESLPAAPTLHGPLALGYLALFGSIVAFSTDGWLLRYVPPVLGGCCAYVNPAIAAARGAWPAGERFTAHDPGAIAVILAGVVTITLARVL